jgi:murein DD-endopeptidase MepM/ murein hydrolase activator NlpD
MLSIKDFFKNTKLKSFIINLAIYLPLSLLIFYTVFYFVQKHIAAVQDLNRQEVIYFKKYEGSLKKRLNTALEEAALSKTDAQKIVNKLGTVLDMRRLAPRDKYLLTMTPGTDFKMLVVTKDFSRYYVAADAQGELVAGIMDISVKTRERFAKGDIESSLFASMQKAGMKPAFIIDFADIFSWAIDFNIETRQGDEFACLWQEDYTAGGATLNESISAAYYKGSFAGKHYAIRFEDEFYDENGKFSKKMFLKSPISVRGVRITSRFSNSRLHPILRIRRPHYGIDYAAPIGTPVESVGDGTIIFKGWKGGFGNYIEISHPNNFVTCYGHLKDYSKNINTGAKVRQGQTIGYVGSSGLSTGPHLDFRIRQGKKYMDFLNNKNRSSAAREIPAEKREEFNKIRDEYIKLLEEKAST